MPPGARRPRQRPGRARRRRRRRPAPAPLPATDWTTYHRDAARTGAAPASPAAGPLSIAWRRRLDGAVYGQPLVVGGLVIAATEGDTVYGLDRATGRVRWHVHLGTPVPLSALPCGDIDPLGITGTPVYDPATRLVYAVAETTGFRHVLAGITVPGGKLVFSRNVPTPDGHPRYDQQRSALALDRGRVYVAFGGLAGDCGPYQGSVNGVPASGPRADGLVQGADGKGRRACGRAGGPVVGPAGTIYVSAGNGAATAPPWDGSDSVTALTPGLRRTGIFAPVTWPQDNASDLDLGSSPPALLSDGVLLIAGKRGTGYLLNASHLAGVGSQVAQAPVCPAYGGLPWRARSCTCPARAAGWPPWTPRAAGSRCSGAARRGPRARRCSAAARSGSRTGTPACCTSSIRAPARSGTRSGWARRCPTSPRRRCPARSPWSAPCTGWWRSAARERGPACQTGAVTTPPEYPQPPAPAFLFDLDGTLIDSVYQHVIAWRTALARLDIDLSVWRIHRRIGMSGGLFVSALLRETGRTLSGDDIAMVQIWHSEEYLAQADSVRPLPGAAELLATLTEHKIPWAIATSSYQVTAVRALAMLGLPPDTPLVTRDMVAHAKPDPDLFLAAAAVLGIDPQHAFVVGDSVWDLLAARRAGAIGIGLLSGGYGREELERAGAYRVYADPADLLARAHEVGLRLG